MTVNREYDTDRDRGMLTKTTCCPSPSLLFSPCLLLRILLLPDLIVATLIALSPVRSSYSGFHIDEPRSSLRVRNRDQGLLTSTP
jgi:hypothetical protein